jgi:hypothetical protein
MKEQFDHIKLTLLASEKSTNAPKVAAATLLLPVFKDFWNVMSKALNDQESDLKELHDRVASKGDYLEALTALELMETWLALMALIAQFNTVYKLRVKAEAAYTSATSVKKTVVTDYEAFCDVLAVTLATAPTEALRALFGEVDVVRKKYAPRHRLKLDAEHTTTDPIPAQPYDDNKPVQPRTRVWYQAITEAEAKAKAETEAKTKAKTAADTEPKELEFTVDYEVSYKNNKKVGEATMIIHGKGKYIGRYYTKFFIVK